MATDVVWQLATDVGELAVVRSVGNGFLLFTPRSDEPDPVGMGYGTMVVPLAAERCVELGRKLVSEFGAPPRRRRVEEAPSPAPASEGGAP